MALVVLPVTRWQFLNDWLTATELLAKHEEIMKNRYRINKAQNTSLCDDADAGHFASGLLVILGVACCSRSFIPKKPRKLTTKCW